MAKVGMTEEEALQYQVECLLSLLHCSFFSYFSYFPFLLFQVINPGMAVFLLVIILGFAQVVILDNSMMPDLIMVLGSFSLCVLFW